MAILKRYRQDQKLLLGPSLDESVTEDGEMSLIKEVVNALDLFPLLIQYEGDGPMVGTISFRIRLPDPQDRRYAYHRNAWKV